MQQRNIGVPSRPPARQVEGGVRLDDGEGRGCSTCARAR